ncbi:hypothetical protein FO521_03375 [Bacillus pseudomycoides]|uniref:Uncharacterized protein n=1 Tax=Bacillus pseudomycoides TaxID=64104 RepID=A0AAJ1YVT0_9BACI|nr:hypothetical protein [Bacillus pseudomycoides]MDR4324785.1 hypothetical protein [Bacillus pseudomycoides]
MYKLTNTTFWVYSQKLLVKLPDLSQIFHIAFTRNIQYILAVTETRNIIITLKNKFVNIYFNKLKTDITICLF